MSLKGRRVLVTGAGGFIGSHLVEQLLSDGAKVRALCEYNPNGSWGWLDTSPQRNADGLDVRLGDIRDPRFVAELCRDVEVVYHLAALISIPYSYEAAQSYFQTNLFGTLNVLEGVRQTEVTRMVHCSTSEVYGTPDSLPITETHPLQAQSPYSASKIAADKACESYACSFGTPVVTVRPFNTYGPRQSARAVIPTILTQLLAGAPKVRLGNLHPKRDLTFVEDTADGILRMGHASLTNGDVIQLGSGRAVSIADLFDLATQELGVESRAEIDPDRVRPEKSEVQVLLSEPARAKKQLGWQAQVGLEDGLRRTAEWLREHQSDYAHERYHR